MVSYPISLTMVIFTEYAMHIVIVIDVFRAFTTASYVLERYPKIYILSTKSSIIATLASKFKNPLLIGKSEKMSDFVYDIPNSPTRVRECSVAGRAVLHRTEAGAQGVLLAQGADRILATSFVNADATVRYLQKFRNPKVTILPMGHEAKEPSLEDEICALYIKCLINNKKLELKPFLKPLRQGSGRYF